MKTIQTTELSFKQFVHLADQGRLRHGVSVREGPDGGAGKFSRREPQDVRESKKLFCTALGFDVTSLVRHKQVHGTRIAVVTRPGEVVGEADGLCTNRFDIALMLLGADCPLLIVYDPSGPAVGLAHAGWRGTVQRVTRNLVETMTGEFGSRTEDMLAGIGPGICKNCYIVGEEVMMIAMLNLRQSVGLFRPARIDNDIHPERWYFDLIEANRRELLEAGIPTGNIETSGYCTFERNDLFPSYRRDGSESGRWLLMAGLANVK